jgi:NADH dehydrogenase [ubiquinone] 1 alpha subcomplex assembly factor 2
MGPGRWRRIVKYPRSVHYADVKVSPLWHQWLRHTRRDPPSLDEQTQDVVRQERTKLLAAQADARWEAKPRVMETPPQERDRPLPALNKSSATQPQHIPDALSESTTHEKHVGRKPSRMQEIANSDREKDSNQSAADPWERARRPSETWQPDAWNPSSSRKS